MTGDGHVPFRGSLGVKLPGATRLRVRCVDGPGVPDRPVRTLRAMTWWCIAAARRQARHVRRRSRNGWSEVGLALHPEKTRIVYCKDGNRQGSYGHVEFDFLGFGFRKRTARTKDGKLFVSFLPAISKRPCAESAPRCGPGGCTIAHT